MIQRLTVAEIVSLARESPEQTVFDWKRTFEPPRDEDAKGEFVKDVMSIANGCAFTRSEGYVVYGINPEAPEPVVGIRARWDDNEAQKIVRSVLAPAPDFLYYEVDADESRTIGVVRVEAPRQPFYIVRRDIGRLREGQSTIRQGSVTRGVTFDDHRRLYLTPGYGYAEQILQKYGVAAQQMNAENQRLRLLADDQKQIVRQMYSMAGLRRRPTGPGRPWWGPRRCGIALTSLFLSGSRLSGP